MGVLVAYARRFAPGRRFAPPKIDFFYPGPVVYQAKIDPATSLAHGRTCSIISPTRLCTGYLSEPKSPSEVKKLVKDFVRLMVKGREMSVLREDGSLRRSST